MGEEREHGPQWLRGDYTRPDVVSMEIGEGVFGVPASTFCTARRLEQSLPTSVECGGGRRAAVSHWTFGICHQVPVVESARAIVSHGA